jgi:aminoglycoside phosphotransferase (APT) family kinase protein
VNKVATARPPRSDAAALRACLERQVVPRLTGARSPVVEVQRAPAPAATSYASFVVSARLVDGRVLRVFLKDYSVSRRPRRDLRARRDRELRVYHELLPLAALSTARHLGAVWEEGAARHWLLLELVEGPVLRDLELEHWIAPLSWLGRLHARFAGAWDGSTPPAFLERYDGHCLSRKADRALAVVVHRVPRLAGRMGIVRERFERILPLLTAGPRTLLHGAFLPANVIVAPEEPPRICPVDWELAAVGSPFYDVACFCDGFEPPTLDEMLAAYRRGAEAGGLALPPDDEVLRRIDGFRLHRVMDWLEQAIRKHYPDDAIEALVSRGETLSALG